LFALFEISQKLFGTTPKVHSSMNVQLNSLCTGGEQQQQNNNINIQQQQMVFPNKQNFPKALQTYEHCQAVQD
jgi:hypothetical protein